MKKIIKGKPALSLVYCLLQKTIKIYINFNILENEINDDLIVIREIFINLPYWNISNI